MGKTGVGGTLLAEAKYINLSLHFLEQVHCTCNSCATITVKYITIMCNHKHTCTCMCMSHLRMYHNVCVSLQVIVALSEKSRVHIPYRNSMMTSILRDRYIFVHLYIVHLLYILRSLYMYNVHVPGIWLLYWN